MGEHVIGRSCKRELKHRVRHQGGEVVCFHRGVRVLSPLGKRTGVPLGKSGVLLRGGKRGYSREEMSARRLAWFHQDGVG